MTRQQTPAAPGLIVAILCLGLAATSGGLFGSKTPKAQAQTQVKFESEVRPVLANYCYGCHGEKRKADLDLRIYTNAATALADRDIFTKVMRNLSSHEMPPEGKPQPSPTEREQVASWIQNAFFPCDCDHPDPGRVTLRRLNRAEYNNTIRDLVGVDFQPAKDFPADDSGYGFDNIGDVLSMSPVLLEKYLAAAEKILDHAIVENPKPEQALPETHRRIFIDQPKGGKTNDCARRIVGDFARRAYRRPLVPGELAGLMTLYTNAANDRMNFEAAVKVALQGALVSPQFLFPGLPTESPQKISAPRRLDDYALASRLSYFLWSSMPDDELFRLAERGRLRRNLDSQARRMLKDSKASAFVENFAGQWLQLRNLKLAAPDTGRFKSFDDQLRRSMLKEAEMTFDFVARSNRSVLEFIQADYTFVDERLAKLYGLPDVKGEEFRRVKLDQPERGGLLTEAAILTLTSNPNRTSPVKRGKWVLENILGAPPPPPPPNVPDLKEGKDHELKGSLRQRMEQHRADPNCSSCHARMDPIGFAFENYNAIGAWRTNDGDFVIETEGKLYTGEEFTGPAQLKQILANTRRTEFVRCLTEKMLTYALGRGTEYYDKCAVDKITQDLARHNYEFETLILGVVNSVPFQMQRAGTAEATAAIPQTTKRTLGD